MSSGARNGGDGGSISLPGGGNAGELAKDAAAAAGAANGSEKAVGWMN
jgi:hypothetical protein